jgi:hypothetical protein
MLEAEYTTKKNAGKKNNKVIIWTGILAKEEDPLRALAKIVPNSYYAGPHGEEPGMVLNVVEVLRGVCSPVKRDFLNLSICALCLKWKHVKQRGAKTEYNLVYESTYMAKSISIMFAWMNDEGVHYKNTEFNRSRYRCKCC